MAKIVLVTGSLVGYAYAMEFFVAWYSGNPYEQFAFVNRAFGQYAWAYWIMVSCNVISPQIFWFKKMRTNMTVIFIVSIFVNIGMVRRFVITVTFLANDFLPWAGRTSGQYFDIATFIGLRFFLHHICLFVRYAHTVAIAEVNCSSSRPHFPREVEASDCC